MQSIGSHGFAHDFRIPHLIEDIIRYLKGQSDAAAIFFEAAVSLRIGMPRVLNMYSTAPFFRAYFEAAGLQKKKKGVWQRLRMA